MTKRVIITAIIVALSFLTFFLIGAEQIATQQQTSTQYSVAFEPDNTSVERQEACRIGNQPFYLLALACFTYRIAITRQPILLARTTTSKHTPTQLLQYIERLTRAPNARTT